MSFTDSHFIIDGIESDSIGVNGISLVQVGGGEISRPVIGNRSINKETVKDKTYFYGIEKSPLEFDLEFSLLDKEFTQDVLFEINNIFAQDKYVSFKSSDYGGIIFYVITTSIELITYGRHQGWLKVHLENFSDHAFSEIQTYTRDFSTLTSPQTFDIDAKFNVNNYYFPKILVDLKGTSTGFTIKNLSDGGKTFGFTGLSTGESLEIDKPYITSSTGNYRLDKLTNHNFLRLVKGRNILSIDSKTVIQVVSQYPVYI
jgi:hypothetical protein